ncbi:MAG: hypothetical protein KatS3mg111_0382 [Pirellulaceae bacterium]|nr:MAG: hypothetical protein KatS3mg111_0382 [Pirellulaceae bacterium]
MGTKYHNYESLTEALKAAIAERDVSLKELERQTGLTRQSIARFAAGTQSLRLDLADRLAAYFGIEIRRKGR